MQCRWKILRGIVGVVAIGVINASWWGATGRWYTRKTRTMERRRWGLVALPRWTPIRGWSLARWIISLIMVMMPATLAHVAVATDRLVREERESRGFLGKLLSEITTNVQASSGDRKVASGGELSKIAQLHTSLES